MKLVKPVYWCPNCDLTTEDCLEIKTHCCEDVLKERYKFLADDFKIELKHQKVLYNLSWL